MNFVRASTAVALAASLFVFAREGGTATRLTAPAPQAATVASTSATFLAVGSSARTVSLGWTVRSGIETDAGHSDLYAIERRQGEHGGYTRIATLSAAAGGYLDSGLAPGTTYGYRLTTVGHTPRVLLSATATTSGEEPVVTGVGRAIGAATHAALGPAGGRVDSPDGRFGIELPAARLPPQSPLGIVLQPVASTAPDAQGPALHVQLDALPRRPLRLHARYEAALAPLADGLRIAVQRHDGTWLSLPPGAIDKRTRTLSATLPLELLATSAGPVDFTVAPYLAVSLAPPELHAQADGTHRLVPWSRIRGYDLEAGSCDALAEGLDGCLVQPVMASRRVPFLNSKPGYARHWRVVPQEGGDAPSGTIAPAGEVGATFTAEQAPGYRRVRVDFESTHERTGRSVVLSAAIDLAGKP